MKNRVVIDTSTLIGAALRSKSIPDRALRRALDEGMVCASLETIAELRRVLDLPKFDRYTDAQTRRNFLTLAESEFRIFAVPEFQPSGLTLICRTLGTTSSSLWLWLQKLPLSSAATRICSPSIPGTIFGFSPRLSFSKLAGVPDRKRKRAARTCAPSIQTPTSPSKPPPQAASSLPETPGSPRPRSRCA